MSINANPNIVVIAVATLLLAILAGLFALVWHGSVSGDQALVLVGAMVTALLGIVGVHSGVSAGAKAAKMPPAQHGRLPE